MDGEGRLPETVTPLYLVCTLKTIAQKSSTVYVTVYHVTPYDACPRERVKRLFVMIHQMKLGVEIVINMNRYFFIITLGLII